MEKIDWKQTGLLEGLEGKQLEIVEKLFNKIDFKKIYDADENDENLTVETLISPVIRRIVSGIMNERVQPYVLQNHLRGITEDDLLPLIDVQEITELLIDYGRTFIPYGEKYLPDLDAQAELTVLFCSNYVMKLINRCGKWK